MKFKSTKKITDLEKQEILNSLSCSKNDNKKYLHQILSIKDISVFDIDYIMNNLNLNDNKIKIINLALNMYEKSKYIKETESYSDFLFRIVRNIEKLEKRNTKFLKKIENIKINIENLKSITDFLVAKSVCMFENNCKYPTKTEFIFSKVYIDN